MNRPRTSPAWWALVAALLFPLVAAGQQPGDPFARRHAELLRAAEAHLEQLRAELKTPPRELAAPAVRSVEEDVATDPLAGIAADRVGRAQKRLLALGVDAARVFAEEGVPLQLLVVAEVESGFDPVALSSKGARGLWQLMPATARRFGLRVDDRVDERLHPARVTRAAARYLRELYLLFGDWELALAAYNAGEQRVLAAIQRASVRRFDELAARRFLPEETRRYVPAVLSAGD